MSYVNKVRNAGKKSDFFPFTAYVEEVDAARIAYDADAQIAALTERLRAVEAERDYERAQKNYAMEWHDKLCELVGVETGWGAIHEAISALRAELERRDAALKEVLVGDSNISAWGRRIIEEALTEKPHAKPE